MLSRKPGVRTTTVSISTLRHRAGVRRASSVGFSVAEVDPNARCFDAPLDSTNKPPIAITRILAIPPPQAVYLIFLADANEARWMFQSLLDKKCFNHLV
ncbi:hypothetical protein D9756_011423 [Leucocoprinus leucothites]|uniref:Uncharacterized protein n=1 Tax=Leucocoprinus leucothites TaxID=201217 RepID=A0A8H5CNY5_9AGAR|nr:hypothetical protein D9756_011423 [Leucoagaricus leucothites]